MSIARLASYALGILAASAIFAGCSTGGSQPSALASIGSDAGPPLANPLAHLHGTTMAVRPGPLHVDHRKSWISPQMAGAPRLLFVSDDSTNDVDVFTMPALALVGTLTGFSEPQGLCSDTNGNIWVTNEGTQTIYLVTRGGLLINVVYDPDGYPVGCAVDPATGNLAVTNIYNVTLSGPGETEVYPAGGGPAYSYANPAQYNYYSVGFAPPSGSDHDTAGDHDTGDHHHHHHYHGSTLYVDGLTSYSVFILSKLTSGSSSMTTVPIHGGTIYFPGMVQWDRAGNYLAVGDQLCLDTETSCVYHVGISGSTGSITGVTNLLNYNGTSVCDLVQGVIAAHGLKYLAGGDYEYCGYAISSVDRWPYPAGGSPTNFNDYVVGEPIGAAISTRTPPPSTKLK